MQAKEPDQRPELSPEMSAEDKPTEPADARCAAVGYRPGEDTHASRSQPGAPSPRIVEGQEGRAHLKGSHPGDRYVRVVRATPKLSTIAVKTVPRQSGRIKRWLLQGHTQGHEAPYEREANVQHTKSWWRVMYLTGVDYFSTLGYQSGIAALAAGFLSPVATVILVLLTLFGALPIYRRLATESPHGEGSIAMLERFLPWWQGKLLVLALLGFAATDFAITITLSAADATAHVIENPLMPHGLGDYRILITLFLVALLGAVFLKGFGEAIGIAVGLVVVYLGLNVVVSVVSIAHIAANLGLITDWRSALFAQHGNPLAMVGIALLLFPRLALGLSGFETGVSVTPLITGEPGDDPRHPEGRIRNTRRLLTTAAVIMSVFLITSRPLR